MSKPTCKTFFFSEELSSDGQVFINSFIYLFEFLKDGVIMFYREVTVFSIASVHQAPFSEG